MAKTKPKTKKGGAREGSGRRALYGEPLTAIVAVQLDAPQSKAIIAWARKHGVSVAMLMRESTLARAGAAALGVGLDAEANAPGWAEPRDVGKWPLKFTASQHDAVSRVAERVGLTMRQYVLEATLAHIGRDDLGERAAIEERERALEKFAKGTKR